MKFSKEHLGRLRQDVAHLTEAQDLIGSSNLPYHDKIRLYDLTRDSIVSLEDIITTCETQEIAASTISKQDALELIDSFLKLDEIDNPDIADIFDMEKWTDKRTLQAFHAIRNLIVEHL